MRLSESVRCNVCRREFVTLSGDSLGCAAHGIVRGVVGRIEADREALDPAPAPPERFEAALHRIAEFEVRSDRRHRGMVGVDIVDDIKRIARVALGE